MAGMAQDESRRISERTQFGVIQSMKRGVAFGNIVYGYDFVRDELTGKKTKLVVNEKEAEVVKDIYSMYLNEGKGAYTIAKILKERGVEIKRPRKTEKSTDWREETILDILRNVKYIGDLKQRRTYTTDFLEHTKKFNKGEVDYIYYENHHQAIIDKEIFELTQKELERRSKLHKHEKSKYTNIHTFSGKLECACCGASYVAGENRKRKDGTIRKTWRCYTATKYGKKHIKNDEEIGCNNERVNNEILKECFSRAFNEIISNKEVIQNEIEQYIREAVKKCGDETEIVDILLKEKEQINKEKNKLLDLCLKEIINEETYNVKNQELENKIKKLNKQIDEQEDKKKVRDNIDEIIENVRNVVYNILNIKEFSKNVCRELVDKVVIYNNRKFDFYLKGYNTPFIFEDKSNILSLQRLL